MTQGDYLLRMEGITKTFPGVLALQGASLHVGRGEVHALIGENGAGKSTLIKILTGAYARDSGTILFDGQLVAFHSPQQAQANGVSTIYQEVNLVPFRSVSENIYMGREPRRWGFLPQARAKAGPKRNAPGIATVMIDAFNITQDRIARSRLAGDPPDLMISPKLAKMGLFEFHRAAECIELGRQATERILPDLRELLKDTVAAG